MEPRPKDDGYDVSDSTDWNRTPLSSLMEVEQSLRCHVCKDFFNSPMITSCCHTFCSLCIRRALNTDGKCPLCRTTDQESKLRGNYAIREACDAFVKARPAILELARRPAASAATTPPKRKADEACVGGGSANKRTRMSTRSSSTRAMPIREESIDSIGEGEEEDEDEYTPDDGLVECPICTWRMKAEKVSDHMDRDCPGEARPQPKPSKSTKPAKFGFASTRPSGLLQATAPERLASTNYSILNETKLRKKMSDIGIPAWGNKVLMERRHREWVMLWNANCDSTRPKTKQMLLHDLDTWERTQGGHASMSSASANLGAQIKDKDFDGAGWSAKHSGTFDDLIAQARKSRKDAQKTPTQSRLPSDATEVESHRANGFDSGPHPATMDTDDARPIQTPDKTQVTVDLTSPVRLPDHSGNHVPAEEHTNVDTIVTSAFVGTHI